MTKIIKNIKYGVLLCVASMLLLSACNDDFMQQDPIVDMAEGVFLRNVDDLQFFLNQFYNMYIIGHGADWGDRRRHPIDVVGSPLMWDDVRSDNLVVTGPNAPGFMSGTAQSPQTGGGWEWGRSGPSGTDPSGAVNLRAINYFLRNYRQAEGSVNDPSELDRWAAEARFFKAMHYFYKVKMFGEVPWFTYDLNVDSPELFAPRTPREELMDSVLWTINFAIEHLPDNANPTGRINRDMALFLKARIALFEGTFRKYHTEHGLTDWQRWLEYAVEACEELIQSGRYELFNTGANPYWRLFTFANNPIADGNREAILARAYDGLTPRTRHAQQRYFAMNRLRQQIGATRSLVDEYLMEDGRPMIIGGTPGNWIYHPNFEGYGMWRELRNRDPRLRQTIAYPGEFITIAGAWDNQTMDRNANGITFPPIGYQTRNEGFGNTVTGYWVIKHWMGDRAQFNATQGGTQTAVVFRYAEVLLTLAEAKAELGTLTDPDLDRTVNALRQRAGFNFATHPNARLTIANVPADPRLDAILAEKLDYSVSPLLREIRRERRIELAVEGRRYFDLMRWRAGGLLTVPMRGTRFTTEMQELYDGRNHAGTGTGANRVTAVTARLGTDVVVDSDGFIIAHPRDPNIIEGTLPWSNYRYFRPIPIVELTLNPNLVQNPGWRAN